MRLQQKRKNHFALFVILAVLIASTAGWLYYQNQRMSDQVARTEQETAAYVKKMNILIAKLEKIRIEKEIKARAKDQAIAAAQGKSILVNESINDPHRDPSKIDVLINKKHPVEPINYVPNLVDVSCAGGDVATINPQVENDFLALCNVAKTAGVPLGISSSYRSYTTQVSTYNYWISISGKAGADHYSARPGFSEHQTGFAIDFGVAGGAGLSEFTGTAQQKWMAANAYKYGFIQRYTEVNKPETGYDAESWHYRYIGRDAAARYTSSHTTSLEKFWNLIGGLYY